MNNSNNPLNGLSGLPSFAGNMLANAQSNTNSTDEESDNMNEYNTEQIPESVQREFTDNSSGNMAVFGNLTREEFKKLKEIAMARLSKEDALLIGRIMDDDPHSWQFLFLYVFGGQTAVVQRIEQFYKKADEFADLIRTAERINQDRMEGIDKVITAFKDHAAKEQVNADKYLERAVHHVVANAAGSISKRLNSDIDSTIRQVIQKHLENEREAFKEDRKNSWLMMGGIALLVLVATAAIGFTIGKMLA